MFLILLILYSCDECERHFTQKIHLRKHLEKHHPEIDFEYAMKEQASETFVKVENTADDGKVIVEEYEVIETMEDDGESAK